jgi:hypothetical protein
MERSTTRLSKFKTKLLWVLIFSAISAPTLVNATLVNADDKCANGLSINAAIDGCKIGCSAAFIQDLYSRCMESCVYDSSGCKRGTPHKGF